MELRMDVFNALNANTTLHQGSAVGTGVLEAGRALCGRAAWCSCPGDLVAPDCAVRRDVHLLIGRPWAGMRRVSASCRDLRVRRPSRVFPRVFSRVGRQSTG